MSYDYPTRAVSDSHNRLTAVVHNAQDTCGLADAAGELTAHQLATVSGNNPTVARCGLRAT